jgi:hypothetical protein
MTLKNIFAEFGLFTDYSLSNYVIKETSDFYLQRGR